MMTEAQPDYLAYLLRLWRVSRAEESQGSDVSAAWWASLEDPHTGEQRAFASLEALFDSLKEQTGGCGRGTPTQVRPEEGSGE